MVDASGNWKIEKVVMQLLLRRTTTAQDPIPNDLNTTVALNIVAHNNTSTDTSQEAQPQVVKIKVLPDSNLSAPIWKPMPPFPALTWL